MIKRRWKVDLFEGPIDGESYVIGGDPAGGMASSSYSAIHVLRCSNMKVVCVHREKTDPDQYEKLVEALGYIYNKALICIERNRDGQGINSYLLNNSYPNLYFGLENKVRGQAIDARPGVYLGKQNRRTVQKLLADVIRNKRIEIPHQQTIEELRKFIKDKNGEGHAPEGFYDDLVWSLSYAVIAYTESRYDQTFRGGRKGAEKESDKSNIDTTKNPHHASGGSDVMW